MITSAKLPGPNCGNCDNCLSPPRVWDGTVVAQKALSCVYRTGQRFGAVHLIDVLIGRSTERVVQFGHDQLSVFGVGTELNEKQWRTVVRQLVALGHLQPDSEAFGALKAYRLGARRPKRRERSDAARRDPGLAFAPAEPSRGVAILLPASTAADKTGDPTLVGVLRAWRSGSGAQARRAGLMPMLHDSTIDGIATRRPTTLEQLRGIPGIGDKKLEHYGAELIALVNTARS